MSKSYNLAKYRVFTKDRNAYIYIPQQYLVMLIDNKYTTKHPLASRQTTICIGSTQESEDTVSGTSLRNSNRAEQTYSNVVKQVN